MKYSWKTAAMGLGMATALGTAAAMAQGPGGTPRPAARPATAPSAADQVIVSGTLDIIDRADLASLREGVLDRIEVHAGDEVKKGGHIADLNKTVAELNATKAKLTADNRGELAKATAQQEVATAVYTRSIRLSKMDKVYVSLDQLDKEKAEVALATALIQVAREAIEVNKAEHKIAEQIVAEHEITTPIGGIVTEILKRPGERVGANEPVVRIVNLDRLRFVGFVPIETANRLNVGDVIQVRPTVEGAELEVEKMAFPAKITYIAPEAQIVGRTEIQIHATLKNPRRDGSETGPHLLRAGLKADALITPNGIPAPANAVGRR